MQTLMSNTDLEKMVFYDQEAGVLYVSKNHAFQASVRSYQQLLRSKGVTPQVQQVAMDVIEQKRHLKIEESAEVTERSEMQRIATEIFRKAVLRRASDIHIRVVTRGHTKIFFRVHNDLEHQEEHPASWGKYLCSAIYTAMSDVSDATYEELSRQDGRISSREKLPPGLDGIRIATTPQVDGLVMVLRLLYNDANQSNDICDLGYSQDQKELVGLMKRRPTGINIISGPTGSGKSTTLQRTLLSIHEDCRGTKHIITVEDPPEYPMPGIVQTPVANATTEAARSQAFQEAIKSSMRLDPNIIMIGEMRDTPSAKLGIQAAMTGHQVWTTIHSNGSFAIIDRMIDMGVSINTMCDPTIVTGLICQRLLKVLCPKCKIPLPKALDRYSAHDQKRVMSSINITSAHVVGDGCPACNGSGIAGRTVVAEVVVPDQAMMGYIKKGMKDKAVTYWRERGGISMLNRAIQKINDGLCDPFQAEEEVGPLDFTIDTSSISGDHE